MVRKFPQNFRARRIPSQKSVNFGAVAGQNNRVLPDLLNPKFAEKVQNYTMDGEGLLKSRTGQKLVAEKVGINGFSAGKYWYTAATVDYFMVGYGTTAALMGSDGSLNEIKTNFTANVTDIEIYKDFAFVASGNAGNKLVRIDKATLTPTEEVNAVKSDVLFVRTTAGGGKPGVRLYCGGVDGDTKRLVYTKTDSGAATPWATATDWDVTQTNPESAGDATFKDNITTISSRGDSILVGSETSRTPFLITTASSAGVVIQDVQVGWQYSDHGMARGAIDTSSGTYYLDKSGFRRMKTVSSEDLISANLGSNYFGNATFNNSTIVHDSKNNLILASYGKDSTTNNEVLCYNLTTDAITMFSGWNINIFMRTTDRVYGLSAIDGKMYLLFESYEDNGFSIPTEFIFNVQKSGLDRTSVLSFLEVQAVLFEGEEIEFHFDIEDKFGSQITDYSVWKITGTASNTSLRSWGSTGYGNAGWGSGSGGASVLYQKYHTDSLNIEFLSMKIRVVSNNNTPHTLNFSEMKIEAGSSINLNNLTQVS